MPKNRSVLPPQAPKKSSAPSRMPVAIVVVGGGIIGPGSGPVTVPPGAGSDSQSNEAESRQVSADWQVWLSP